MLSSPRIEIFDTVTSALEVIERARDLNPNSPRRFPSLEFYWLTSFVRNYGLSKNIAFTGVFVGDILVMLLPFQLVPEQNTLRFLCDETADYSDIFVNSGDSVGIEAAVAYWLEFGVCHFLFERLPLESATISLVFRCAERKGGSVRMHVGELAPYVDLSAASATMEEAQWLSRTLKKYEKRRAVMKSRTSFEIVDAGASFEKVWSIARSMHITRWDAKGVTSKYTDSRRCAFIENVCLQAATRGELFIPILRIDGQMAAFIIGFRVGSEVFDWNTSFDLQFRRCSPGVLLLLEVLEYARTVGISRYDFLTGAEDHKFQWATHCDGNVSVELSM